MAFIAWEYTDPWVHDTRLLPTLLAKIRRPIAEFYGDAGYLSARNVDAIVERQAKPYIRPKRTTTGRTPKVNTRYESSRAFRGMVALWRSDPAWLETYHRRSPIESAFGGVKRRFGGAVAAAHPYNKRTEATLKLIAWNLTRTKC